MNRTTLGLFCAALLACNAESRPDARSGKRGSPLPQSQTGSPLSIQPNATLPTPSRPSISVATYNVNYGLAGDPDTLEAIRELRTDMVFLQETNEAWETHLDREFATAYPHRAFRHCCNAGGLAVLSKLPFADLDYVHPPGAWFPAWRIVADSALGKIQIVNVHLRPNVSDGGSIIGGLFTTPSVRRKEIAYYVETIDERLPTVFVGDFNETANGLAIQHLNGLGMRSALVVIGGPQATWHWDTPVGEIKKQFDHVVFGERLEVVSAHVRHIGRSDHYPVLATLQLRAPPP